MSYVSKCQKDVKMSKRCQMSKKSNCWTMDTMRFTHNDVNFAVTNDSHQNWSKTYFINILRIVLPVERPQKMAPSHSLNTFP